MYRSPARSAHARSGADGQHQVDAQHAREAGHGQQGRQARGAIGFHEQRAEEQHFGGQEHPHSKVAGIVLLLDIHKMVGQLMAVAMIVLMPAVRRGGVFLSDRQGRSPS